MSLKTLKPKVAELIEKAQGGDLPDWDDDSPIIATGVSRTTNNITWELTEKGTFRWKVINSESTGASDFNAILFSTNTLTNITQEERNIAFKIKQIYIDDGIKAVNHRFITNCQRIRIPSSLTNIEALQHSNFKELDLSETSLNFVSVTDAYRLEKIILPPSVHQASAAGCISLNEINLENITIFGHSCFKGCYNLKRNIVSSPNLTKIDAYAFQDTPIKSFVFKTPIGQNPTISGYAFTGCNKLTDIFCPWGESEVEKAPWGATKATIHYNAEV